MDPVNHVRTSTRAPLAATFLLLATACAGPALHLEPQPASADQPLAFELRDWDWDRSSLELELRVTNHSDRPVFLARGFLALGDGTHRMAPKSSATTYRIAPGRSRNVVVRYPAVDESVVGLTLEFGPGALSFDEARGEPLTMPPLRMQVGKPPAAEPAEVAPPAEVAQPPK